MIAMLLLHLIHLLLRLPVQCFHLLHLPNFFLLFQLVSGVVILRLRITIIHDHRTSCYIIRICLKLTYLCSNSTNTIPALDLKSSSFIVIYTIYNVRNTKYIHTYIRSPPVRWIMERRWVKVKVKVMSVRDGRFGCGMDLLYSETGIGK